MKIAFIQTGGTLDKDYPQITNGWAFEITTPAFDRILEDLNPNFEWESYSACRKDSTEITGQDRQQLKQLIAECEADKIIVTHGTDTMPETASCLASLASKTIVITGAMRPERFSNSDAKINLGMAIAAVQCQPAGVYIAMHGLVIPHNEIDRNMETGQFKFK